MQCSHFRYQKLGDKDKKKLTPALYPHKQDLRNKDTDLCDAPDSEETEGNLETGDPKFSLTWKEEKPYKILRTRRLKAGRFKAKILIILWELGPRHCGLEKSRKT